MSRGAGEAILATTEAPSTPGGAPKRRQATRDAAPGPPPPSSGSLLPRLALATGDGLAGVAACLAARATAGGNDGGFGVVLVVTPLVWLLTFNLLGLYDIVRLAALEEFRRTVKATVAAVAAVTAVSVWWAPGSFRLWIASFLLVGIAAELTTRRLWRWALRRLRRDGKFRVRTVVVGTGDDARGLAAALDAPDLGFDVVGFVARGDEKADDTGPAPFLGTTASLDAVLRASHAGCVFIASHQLSRDDMSQVLRDARRNGAEVRVLANVPDVLPSRLTMQPVGRAMAVAIRPPRLTTTQAAVKRAFDLVLGSALLIVAAPGMAVIAGLIRLTSRGPALFSQDRVTKDGRVFRMFKFRTMVVDDPISDRVVDLTTPFFKLQDDPRLTSVGRVLRSFSLDELPQLWHVVRGELSLVGPRPLWVIQVTGNEDAMAVRHEVRSGLTGWWQVHGRNDVSATEALEMDLFYVNNWSLTLDLYILAKTVGTIITRRGAY